ncbi:filamentous hemagglutinin N-terminal domain-containing protein [Pseudomonas sp. UBA4194]|uniref:two-partner secretion domain-containing protein n=1 Tax=Pseudomonas sp. UBA4194 TaxID=1947317 RepID=UPI0025D662DF|nr:filamentous hemagglutinin N-terminal domain-containing protein [Pseudomonas sp. UBA4194]
MDVRQFAFLARQASARIQPREQFCGLPKRGLALLLANVMFWQPLWAQAEGIVVSGTGTRLQQAGNGVPIVNIATPDATGLSHNQYKDYNVGSQGVILNNATSRTQNTQLGGIIVGNPNLAGSAAHVILNEVTGGNPSQLRGYTEVAGQSAKVIVANPYGMTCNGCGFINTPQVTLTTGKPIVEKGQLQRYQVDGGAISIDGQGLNASNVDGFEIITRSARINAQINARNLTIVTGRNDVDATTLHATARADDGSTKPQLAIDSSALGGMYAGAIKLVGTEAGVGVKLAGNLAASAGDIQLDANGHLRLAQAGASGAVNIAAQSLDAQGPVYAGSQVRAQTRDDLTISNTLAARDSIALTSGGQLTNSGIIEAGVNADDSRNAWGDVHLKAQGLNNRNSVIASRNLDVVSAGAVDNQGATLSAEGRVATTATHLNNSNHGRVLSASLVKLDIGEVHNEQALISSTGGLEIDTSRLVNNAGKLAGSTIGLRLATLDNVAGVVWAGQMLDINASGVLNNQTGRLISQGDLQLVGGHLDNRDKGAVQSRAAARLTSKTLNNQSGLLSAGSLTVTLDEADNGGGRIASRSDLTAAIGILRQQGGELVAQGQLSLTGDHLDNRSGGLLAANQTLIVKVNHIDNRAGKIAGLTALDVTGQHLDNSGGQLLAGTDLMARVAQLINQQQGLISAEGQLRLSGTRLSNQNGKLASQQAMTLDLSGELDNQQGLLTSEAALTLAAMALRNDGGRLTSTGNLAITSQGLLSNRGGTVVSNNALTLKSASLDNSQQGLLSGKGAVSLQTDDFDNRQGGRLTGSDTLNLSAGQVSNGEKGSITSAKALKANLAGLAQQGGKLYSNTALSLDLNGGVLDNRQGLVNAPQLRFGNLAEVNNQGGEISSTHGFELVADSLDNSSGKVLSIENLALRIGKTLHNLKGLVSARSVVVNSKSLNNRQGLLSSLGTIDITSTGLFDNRAGTLIGDHLLRVQAGAIDNREGEIAGKQDVDVRTAGLDNRNGKLIAQGALLLTATQLDNRQSGLVTATKALELHVDNLDNRGGELSSQAEIELSGHQLDNDDAGQVSAQGSLTVAYATVLNRAKGLLSGKTGINLQADSLDNSDGRLLSQRNIDLLLTGAAINQKGLISGEGTLHLSAGSLDNTGGKLSSAELLTLDSRGLIMNRNGELITDQGLTLSSASLDNSQGGRINAKGALNLTTGAFNNDGGVVSSANTLDLTADAVSNLSGRIGSQLALTASLQGLATREGKFFSDSALTLDLNGADLDNRQGLLYAPSLALRNVGAVYNQGGEISSGQAFMLKARSLDNSAGKLLSNQTLTLQIEQTLANLKGQIAAAALSMQAASLDNSEGVLTSRSELNLTSQGSLLNRNNGVISAATVLDIHSSELDNHGGQLLGNHAVRLDLNGGTLGNSAGLINSDGPLTFTRIGAVDNRDGEISSNQGFTLASAQLDNSAGRIISSGQLSVIGGAIINRNGLLSGWQGLNLQGSSLDNRDNGTVSSLSGNLTANLSGVLLNSNAGALTSAGRLDIDSARLDNSQGGILSSGAGQTLTVQGTLDNSQAGLIDSGAQLTVRATSLSNRAGTVTSQQALTLTGTTLDNTGGQLASNGSITLDLLGTLINAQGTLASGGPLRIQRATHIDNQGGQLASQSVLSLFAGGLDNRNRGTVASLDQLTVDASGTVHNDADGLIYSQNGAVSVTAAALENSGGAVQSQAGLTLLTGSAINNANGRLIAQNGDLILGAGSLDNRGGILSSLRGALEARVTGGLLNNQGTLQGQRLTLVALAGLDNQNGRIAAQSGDASITTADLNNSAGALYAKGLIDVSGNTVTNAGQIAGGRVRFTLGGSLINRSGIVESDSFIDISAASLDNQSGTLRALGTDGASVYRVGGVLDNRGGVIESANSDLTIDAGSFRNTNGSVLHVGLGEFNIASANVIAAGGSLVTRGGLTLNADHWTNSGVLQAGRLTINVDDFHQTASGQLLASQSLRGEGANWHNDGTLASDGDLWLGLTGTYSGNGRVTSLGNLQIGAAQLQVAAPGSITSGAGLRLDVGGALFNQGRITSLDSAAITAGNIDNHGTLGSGQSLKLKTGALLNERALLFSGGDMGLQVDTFTNRYADVYSLANLRIDRDGNGGHATLIRNSSSTLQSDGSMSLAASTIENVREVLSTHDAGVYTGKIYQVACIEGVNAGDCSGKRNFVFEVLERQKLEVTQASQASSITAGGDLSFSGGDLLNYSSTIATGGNLNASVTNLFNLGIETGDTEVVRTFRTDRQRGAGGLITQASAFNEQYWLEGARYDASNVGGLEAGISRFLGYMAAELPELARVTPLATGDQRYAAVIQAVGDVNITTQNNFDNSVVRNDYHYIGSDTRTDTRAPGSDFSTRVSLNPQLPPDLAQQQINPLALPGFSLPTGQHGLFRLSDQSATDSAARQADTAPQNWTLGSASIDVAQRTQTVDVSQGRTFEVAGQPAVELADRDVQVASHQETGSDHLPGAIIVADLDSSAADLLLPGRTDTEATISNSQPIGSLTGDAQGQTGVAAGTTAAAAYTINRVQGLPEVQSTTPPHKYLIETNPVLTDLKQFLSSDYLLAELGYNPDESAKRLGDGFYEQKLIQQALVARTGQRFIDGQHSDEALFKYLMNNAVASKQQLNLSVGTTLTPAQVAALTHDIVWLEEYEVNGEKVLVPVLYLAHANGRVGPNGALVAGRDVNLISGNALTSAGTLKASNNLSASAGNNLVNSGLVQAGNRLDLLAGNTLVNQAGGVIAGRDVSLTAAKGDVINERTVTSHQSSGSYRSERKDFADTAARIEAANDLSVWAGRDVSNVGGVLQSGNDLTLAAGRDINVTSAEQVASNDRGRKANSSSVTQLGSSVAAGRDVIATAGRDLTAIASDIDAKRDIALAAVGDLTLGSAADERHAYFKSKKVTAQEDHVSQVGTSLTAGGDVALTAGKDMALVSSRITAGDEAYLYAGENLELLAAQDSDYSLYDKKKKGSLGSKQTQRDETTSVTNVGTEIKTGGNLTLESGGDQKYQAAKLESGKDLTLESGGAIDFAGVKDLDQESHQKSSSDLAWTSMGSKGTTDETLRQSELVAQGTLAIKASAGLNIDIKHIDQNTVSQTIDAMVQADPQLAWLKQAEARGDVNWQQIREVHESFKYDHSGLGQGAMLVIIIIVSVLTAGVASGAAASAGGALGASSTGTMAAATATASAGLGNMAATAALTSMASTATVSAINNKGKVRDTLSDTFSSNSIKGYALAAASAGVAGQLGYDPTQLGFNMDSAGTVAVKAGADSLAQTALTGGSLSDNFASSMISALITAAGAQGANALGNSAMVEGSPSKIAAHALLGGMKSLAMGQDFKTGALAGGANEAMVNYLADLVMPEGYEPGKSGAEQAKANLLALSKVVGVLSSVVTGGDPEVAANIAATATQYNHLNHSDLTRAAQELNACATNDGGCAQDVLQRFVTLSREQEIAAFQSCAANPDSCASTSSMVANAQARAEQLKDLAATAVAPNAQQVFALLLAENNEVQNALAQVTAGAQIDSVVQDLQNRLGFSDARKEMIRDAIVASASMGIVGKAGRGSLGEAKATGEAATQASGRVHSRVNIANGRTETTPVRENGNPVSAGFDHVIDGHFNREISNSRSVFTIAPDELKAILQSSAVAKSPVVTLPDGQFVRTVDVGRTIGTTTLKDGGVPTSVIKVFTDKAGNLITTFPVKLGS